MVSPGSPQQHSGDNVNLYGKGSRSGYEVPGSLANPDGETQAIEGLFDAMILSGGSNNLRKGLGPILNPLTEINGFNDNMNYLKDQLSSSGKLENNINSNSNGSRVDLGNVDWLHDGGEMNRGATDTIIIDGTPTVRHRDSTTGSTIQFPLSKD
jgi:hypothetical protein